MSKKNTERQLIVKDLLGLNADKNSRACFGYIDKYPLIVSSEGSKYYADADNYDWVIIFSLKNKNGEEITKDEISEILKNIKSIDSFDIIGYKLWLKIRGNIKNETIKNKLIEAVNKSVRIFNEKGYVPCSEFNGSENDLIFSILYNSFSIVSKDELDKFLKKETIREEKKNSIVENFPKGLFFTIILSFLANFILAYIPIEKDFFRWTFGVISCLFIFYIYYKNARRINIKGCILIFIILIISLYVVTSITYYTDIYSHRGSSLIETLSNMDKLYNDRYFRESFLGHATHYIPGLIVSIFSVFLFNQKIVTMKMEK